ncbi:MAG: ribokinase [Chloroflexota bacterium]
MSKKRSEAGTDSDPPRVAVVGSAVVDFIAYVRVRPRPGETVLAQRFIMAVGGKGCDQAIAAARMGAGVCFVGCVGDDPLGEMIRRALVQDGVDVRHLHTVADEGTAIGMPVVDESGENAIVMAPRANTRLGPDQVRAAATLLRQADVLLLQGEVPWPASIEAAEIVRAAGGQVVLNAAPAGPFPQGLLRLSDVLVVNEHEVAALAEAPASSRNDCLAVAQQLLGLGPRAVVITLGDQGAYLNDGGRELWLEAYCVNPVDATGAGDAFCGALAAEIAAGSDLAQAVRIANAAGALAVTGEGAEPSLPSRQAVARFLQG